MAADFANLGVQMVHADMGGMGCATSFNPHLHTADPTGLNVTTGSNMTGAAGNTTGGVHSSSILTTHTAGTPTHAPQCSGGTSPNAR